MSGLKQMWRRANKYAEAGRHDDAISLWEQMHRKLPDDASIAVALGSALIAGGRKGDAADWLAKCSLRHPADKDIALQLGRVLIARRQKKEAVGAFYQALWIDPTCSDTHGHLASALYADRASALALPHAAQACRGNLSDFNMSTYLCVLLDLGETERGLQFIDDIMVASSMSRETVHMYRAAALHALGRVKEGLVEAAAAVRLSPGHKVARHHLAAALLAQGELTADAWKHYEGRIGCLEMKDWPSPNDLWTDQDVNGRTVIVHAEQGLGDTLQFIRYIPQVAALGARVIVAVQKSLVALLQGTPGAEQVIEAGNLPQFDYYCPLLSLPGRFSTTIGTIPPPIPYTIEVPSRPSVAALQVGLVWAGGETFVEDRKRSIDPTLLAPLGTIANVDFHSLQFGAVELPLPGMQDAMQGVTDFADTACRIAKLDLVIAVDTSVAHLAATMGKPVWLLNRSNGCWRWLLDREDSPWYPSVRIFRQPRINDWESVVEDVRQSLAAANAHFSNAMALAA